MQSGKSSRRWEALRNVAAALSCFAEEKQYTYIDRIGDALSPDAAIKALKEALRALRSLQADPRYRGLRIPSMEDVEEVIRLIEADISYATRLAALALSSACLPRNPGKQELDEKGGEVKE